MIEKKFHFFQRCGIYVDISLLLKNSFNLDKLLSFFCTCLFEMPKEVNAVTFSAEGLDYVRYKTFHSIKISFNKSLIPLRNHGKPRRLRPIVVVIA